MEIARVLDVPALLAPISADSPCGDDLEYDAAFLELERIAQGQPERQMGDAVLPAEPPEWPRVKQHAIDLFSRSKDLRVASILLRSSLAISGLPGFAQSLVLISELLNQYWAELHPRLDPDDNDPTSRINALTGLNADENIRLLWESLLVRSRTVGPVTLRAAVNAYGLQRFASETLSQEQVAGALRDSDADAVLATRDAVAQALTAMTAIETLVSEQVGSDQGVDLGPLKQMLRQASQTLGSSAQATDGEIAENAGQTSNDGDSATLAAAALVPRVSGEIANRDDVLRLLDRLLDYYARHEPSSPVPVLLSRAKTLVTADFAAIVRNLIPDGMSQFEALRGPDSE
jgi:type VI secretion system protein ImpA